MSKYLIRLEAPQVPPYDPAVIAQGFTAHLARFLFPLLVELHQFLDKRLVRTFLQTIAVMLTFRARAKGLLLSELGGYLLSAARAPAGPKRLWNLLHCAKWQASLITRFLWQRASQRLSQWQQAGRDGLLLAYQLRFVLRWRKDYKLLDAAGNQRLTCKIAQGKRGWSQRWVWDARRSRWVVATVLALPLAHAAHPERPLWLVVCRSQGRSRSLVFAHRRGQRHA